MSYAFNLHIGKESSRLVLLRDGEASVSREWSEARDMGRQLFEAIEEILSEAELTPVEVTSFDMETDVSDNFTSVKIAQAVAQAYELAVKSGE